MEDFYELKYKCRGCGREALIIELIPEFNTREFIRAAIFQCRHCGTTLKYSDLIGKRKDIGKFTIEKGCNLVFTLFGRKEIIARFNKHKVTFYFDSKVSKRELSVRYYDSILFNVYMDRHVRVAEVDNKVMKEFNMSNDKKELKKASEFYEH